MKSPWTLAQLTLSSNVRGEGIVLNEPSVVAIEKAPAKSKALVSSKRMLGRTPDGVLAVPAAEGRVIATST